MNQNETMEIDLLALLDHLRRKLWIIAAVTLVCAVVGLLYSSLFITPQYTSSTRIYVLTRSREDLVTSNDFVISNYMLYDYKELITGRNVTEEVVRQLGLDMSPAALAGQITVSSPEDSRMLQISVTNPDPALAQQLANAIREVTSNQLTELLKVDSVSTIYEANKPTAPSSPNVMRNTMLAGILGFAVMVGIFCVIFLLDDRIRSEADVERYLGLSVIGIIPDNPRLAESKKSATKKKRPGKHARAKR